MLVVSGAFLGGSFFDGVQFELEERFTLGRWRLRRVSPTRGSLHDLYD